MLRVLLRMILLLSAFNSCLVAQVRPKKPITRESGVIMLDGPSFMTDLGAWRIPGVVVGGSGSLCLADTGWVAEARLQKLREVMTADDSDAVHIRKVLAELPRVDSADVALIADAALCDRASKEVSRIYDWMKGRPLYVARAGTCYVAFPPRVKLGEWGVAVYMNRDFQTVAVSVW
jgi:hypothetical protein